MEGLIQTKKLTQDQNKAGQVLLEHLLESGGFPEPFLSNSPRHAQRWRKAYGDTLVREDIRSLENLKDLDGIEILFDRLTACVGSPLSINRLKGDLEVAFETVKHWVSILESVYAVFRIAPFGAPRIKAVKKEQKLYFWDWSRVENSEARLENLVAVHLLRFCHYLEDSLGENVELRYFRDFVGHEADFIILLNK